MALDDPMAQVTRLPNLGFVDENNNVYRVLYVPNLTQEEVIDTPITDGLTGAIAFNKDTEELETYTAAGFWLPILTAESDINVENVTAQTITATTADLYSIQSHDITNSELITTLGLLVQGDAQVNGLCTINDDLIVHGSINMEDGGVTGDFGVNGTLTAGTLGTVGNFQVDGTTSLQETTITGDLTLTGGKAFIDNYSGAIMDINDFEAQYVRVDALLYGQTEFGGASPITATLGTGAGTGATYSILGSNVGGVITINTGTSPSTSNIIATFTLPSVLNPFLNGQCTMITKAGNQVTATYEAASGTYVNAGSGNVIAFMSSTATALNASTTYVWNYMLVGNILGT